MPPLKIGNEELAGLIICFSGVWLVVLVAYIYFDAIFNGSGNDA